MQMSRTVLKTAGENGTCDILQGISISITCHPHPHRL